MFPFASKMMVSGGRVAGDEKPIVSSIVFQLAVSILNGMYNTYLMKRRDLPTYLDTVYH